jgi:2-dehydro-3-deoxygalactonokinase
MKRIAVDWGSSCLRSFLLDQQGNLLDSRQSADGILSLKSGDFASVLQQQCQSWLAEAEFILMAGMVGSRHGWYEMPYLPCPVNLPSLALASQLLPAALSASGLPPIRLVPGLCYTDSHGIADVMRGEETQIFGALQLSNLENAWLCLPGTHSKWARVVQGSIVQFQSFISGELFALLRQHSSLATFCQQGAVDTPSFLQGLQQSSTANNLLHQIFSVRAQVLTGQLPPQAASGLLSGLIIGQEFSAARHWITDDTPLLFVGNHQLNQRYQQAASFFGLVSQCISAETASVAGFNALAHQYD